jgi:putative DeoR family transcriptional regulator (stage III sporulation protein D)
VVYRRLKEDKIELIKKEAQYIIITKGTIRQAAKAFGTTKSTIHKHMTCYLPEINPMLYMEVKEVIEMNKRERHLRGGYATQNKYLKE